MVEIVPARPTVMAALALKRRFHGAPVIMVGLEDWELDIDVGGPVKRVRERESD